MGKEQKDNLLNKLSVFGSIDNRHSWALDVINAEYAWQFTEGEGVKVAIIDTGVDINHKDLTHAIKGTKNILTQSKHIDDNHGHGTHLAGLIAGKNTGVAPKCELYVAKILDDNGGGSMAQMINGITYAISRDVDILSISSGRNRELPHSVYVRLKDAYDKGITIVGAAGNSGNGAVSYPSFYDEIISVGGVDTDLKLAPFSNHGKGLDILAPSVNVLSTYKNGKYAEMNGTSTASPLVAGGIALLISYYRKKGIKLSPKDIKNMLYKLNNNDNPELFDLSKLMD